MIKDIEVGQSINDTFYLKSKIEGTSRVGDRYYSLVLQDMSGIIDAKIWTIPSNIDYINTGDFVQITGTVGSFKDKPQITVDSITTVDSSTVNIEDFCPYTPKNIEELTNKLISYVDSVKEENLNAILSCFFKNDKFLNTFKKSSAAKSVHHAYIGGLLEHTIAVADICEALIPIYPIVNRDLLITAALCHDIGKIKEISAFPENEYTDSGNLLGHIYLGTEMIDVQARKIKDFPKPLLNELKHCILAHHGCLEYGSPKTPMIIEAMLLHQADSTDAKMRRFSDLVGCRDDYSWSDKADFAIGSIYRATQG